MFGAGLAPIPRPWNRKCRVVYDQMIDLVSLDSTAREVVICRDNCWSIDLSDPTHIFYSLPNIEQFWVDQSCIQGNVTAFENIARAWPKLRSLDLYSNNIRAKSLPASFLTQLPNLEQLQLQQNNIAAAIPDEWWLVMKDRIGLTINAQLNPRFDTSMPVWYEPTNATAYISVLGTNNTSPRRVADRKSQTDGESQIDTCDGGAIDDIAYVSGQNLASGESTA